MQTATDILVVDDSRVVRKAARRILERHGFAVREAEDGALALQACHERLPRLVLLDWNMPVMDGLQFVSAVRANPAWRQVTLMMVTTESEHSQIVRALAAGAHEYVIKPFTADAIGDKLALLGLLPHGVPA